MLSLSSFTRRKLQSNIRLAAGVTLFAIGAGLYGLGAQQFAVGLFLPPWDKLAHALTFMVVGFTAGLATGSRGKQLVIHCVIGATAIGAMDEWHQVYLAGRSAGWDDLVADAAGGLLGAALLGGMYKAIHIWTKHR